MRFIVGLRSTFFCDYLDF